MRVAQHRRRRAAIAVAGALVAAVGVLIVLNAQTDRTGALAAKPAATAARRAATPVRRARAVLHLVARKVGSLGAPLQDAAGASLGRGSALLLGGLTAADTSTNAVHRVSATRDRALARLPVAVHDAAAVALGPAVYLFGGGDGTTQHGEILRVDSATGRTALAGQLP
ncbi:MAG TPA: hypothetical protein VIL56_01120, partial [Gaiellaceae bacterium]